MDNSRLHHGRASLRLIKEKQDCSLCDTHHLCSETWPDQKLISAINTLTTSKGPINIGDSVYKMENQFKSLFIIQSGVIKLEKPLEDGKTHVAGFYFSGDVIGLESVGDEQYNYDAIALDPTWVCEVPYKYFYSDDESANLLKGRIITLYAEKLREANSLLALGKYQTSEQRLLQFLEVLCKRHFSKNLSNTHKLQLPMPKGDIANYLGLRPESISRALQKLQSRGVIRNHKNAIEILDMKVAKMMICKS